MWDKVKSCYCDLHLLIDLIKFVTSPKSSWTERVRSKDVSDLISLLTIKRGNKTRLLSDINNFTRIIVLFVSKIFKILGLDLIYSFKVCVIKKSVVEVSNKIFRLKEIDLHL